MNLERKKELLRLVDSIGKDINNDGCGNYIPRVINALEISKKYNDLNKFKIALESMKKSSFGGNSEKQGYYNFVDNIIKKSEYNIDSLNFEELMFVFSWLRRVVKTKSDKKTSRNTLQNNYNNRGYSTQGTKRSNSDMKSMNNYTNNKRKKNNNQNENMNDDNPFAKLKGLF